MDLNTPQIQLFGRLVKSITGLDLVGLDVVDVWHLLGGPWSEFADIPRVQYPDGLIKGVVYRAYMAFEDPDTTHPYWRVVAQQDWVGSGGGIERGEHLRLNEFVPRHTPFQEDSEAIHRLHDKLELAMHVIVVVSSGNG